jgi:signal peptidase II
MFRRQRSDTLQLFVVAALVVAADQLSKRYIATHCSPGFSPCRTVIPGLLRWTYEQNQHGAFGLFGDSPALLIAMAAVVLAVFWLSFRDQARNSIVVRVAFGMILGGAIGNIVDRLHYKFVIDFIDFYKIWPNIFDVADSCITAGVILLILASLATRRRA